MKNLLLAALAATITCGSANAAVLDVAFAGNGFAGTFSFDDKTGDLKSIDFNQGGKVYDLSSAGLLYSSGGSAVLGGLLGGAIGMGNSTSVATNDFSLSFDYKKMIVYTFETTTFGVGRQNSYDYTTRTQTATIRNVTSAVPEPTTWAMMVAGFGLAGFALRRRSRAAAVRFA
ncbi:hypothetical protein F4693_002621 [Sphingomonas endophytica]|jgi:hypothetical protein|uniref:Ice-binding protein C-terminal domain-containing protein n=1 Tax=Sphingomonas endophytica TaxID=869719 RepID=A0A7X0JDI1_9SPHN|nr:PEPxxWA-CTERM sorting domain-containing protein [Sphingomonas endophytica]MBB6505626.1 hypothetical protein [Sphingomonas endophytica]